MNVFTVYSRADAGMLRLWARSWAARGWVPKLLLPRDLRVGNGNPADTVAKRGGVFCFSPRVLNFSYSRPRKTPDSLEWAEAGSPGAATAPLVWFPGATEEDVLSGDRPLLLV